MAGENPYIPKKRTIFAPKSTKEVMKSRIFLWVFSLSAVFSVQAQQQRSLTDGLEYRLSAEGTVGGGDHAPLWLNANKYGLSSVETSSGYLRAAVARPLQADSLRRWGIGYGAELAVAANFTSTLVVQQAYVEARWLKGTLTVGSKEQSLELKNQLLSTGSQTLGINARPVPSIRLALPDYWTVPHTKQWIAIKGHVAYGMTTDDNWQKDFTGGTSKYTKNTLLHTKAGYLRIGPKNITMELGLEMAAQFGGKSYVNRYDSGYQWYENGSGLKDFLAAFVPGMGAEVVEDQYKNSEGNHLGSWGGRLNLDYPKWNLGIYGEHFYEDQSTMYFLGNNGYGTGDNWNVRKKGDMFVYDFKDMMAGAELTLKQCRWLRSIVLEYLYTKYQGGPVYHDHTPKSNIQITGRDEFYNHYIFTGWQHWGQVIGNPLYRSPIYNDNQDIEILNNRFKAWHLGLGGQPLRGMSYRLLATWQQGFGTYKNMYPDPKEVVCLLGEVGYSFADTTPLAGWHVRGAVGMDRGGIYGDNTGVQLTVTKTGLLNPRKK